MPIKESTKKFEYFNFEVLTENMEAFQICLREIREILDKDEMVPAKLLKEFWSYTTSQKAEEEKELYARCNNACLATIEYFKGIKDYIFEGERDREKFDFSKFIGQCINYYIGSIWILNQLDRVTEKKKTIQTLFEALMIYSRKWNKSSKKEDLLISHYKKTVLAAFITHQLGIYVLDPDKNKQYVLNDLYKTAWDYVKHLPQSDHFKKFLEPDDTKLTP